MEGFTQYLSDPLEDIVEDPIEQQVKIVNGDEHDDDHVSFHDDSSNINSTYEDVAAVKKVREKFKEFRNVTDFTLDNGNFMDEGDEEAGGVLFDLSVCDDSDEERWVTNSIDNSDDER